MVIDQFIAAGEEKWLLLSGLVMLLPHGHEGQGPEHSSRAIERLPGNSPPGIISKSANRPTAANYFHMLRRQALRKWRKPLIVFTPKSMLRNPDAPALLLKDFPSPTTSYRSFQITKRQRLTHPGLHRENRHELEAERRKRKDTSPIAIVLILDQDLSLPRG